MNKGKLIVYILIAFCFSMIFCILCDSRSFYEAKEVYRVYMDGESLGLISSKEKLEKYINEEQKEIKEKYNVDNVYIPNGVDIIKEVTYNEKVLSEKFVYDKIKSIHPFTIKGYKITIKKEATTGSILEDAEESKTENIYVLEKEIFDEAISSLLTSFVDKETYEKYLNNTQEQIDDVGILIENVYLKDKVTISEVNINISETIYMNNDEDLTALKAYLLFGDTPVNKYYVKKGDTIESIALKNKLSAEELLVVNTNLKSVNTLLYAGEELNVAYIEPQLTVVEETHVVELQEIKYTTEIRYNYNLMAGTVNEIQKGKNGTTKVTKKVKKENGEIVDAVTLETEEISPVVNRIVERGGKYGYLVGEVGNWKWPTKKPYTISAYRGWRWGRMHEGIDVTGTGGKGSPIYAANDGVVTSITTKTSYGNKIDIDHGNGYITRYAHLDKIYVKMGQIVKAGQVIGGMGNTGRSTGVHLHFEVKYNNKNINPMLLY